MITSLLHFVMPTTYANELIRLGWTANKWLETNCRPTYNLLKKYDLAYVNVRFEDKDGATFVWFDFKNAQDAVYWKLVGPHGDPYHGYERIDDETAC